MFLILFIFISNRITNINYLCASIECPQKSIDAQIIKKLWHIKKILQQIHLRLMSESDGNNGLVAHMTN